MPQYSVIFTVDGDSVCLMLNAADIQTAEIEAKNHIYGDPNRLDIYWYDQRSPTSDRSVTWDEESYMRFEDPCVEDVNIVEILHPLDADEWQRELESIVRAKIDERNRKLELEIAKKNKTISADAETLTEHGFVQWVKKSHPSVVKKFIKQIPRDPSVR